MQYKRNTLDIHESITFLNFIKSICLIFLLGLLNVTIYYFRYLYLDNTFLSQILMIFQIVISYGFEILLITSWLRCFYMSGKIRLGYACIILWISSRFILGIPIFSFFYSLRQFVLPYYGNIIRQLHISEIVEYNNYEVTLDGKNRPAITLA